MAHCRRLLEENLFFLNPCLVLALLEVKEETEAIVTKQLMAAIDPGTTYTLEEFQECHMAKMGFVSHADTPHVCV